MGCAMHVFTAATAGARSCGHGWRYAHIKGGVGCVQLDGRLPASVSVRAVEAGVLVSRCSWSPWAACAQLCCRTHQLQHTLVWASNMQCGIIHMLGVLQLSFGTQDSCQTERQHRQLCTAAAWQPLLFGLCKGAGPQAGCCLQCMLRVALEVSLSMPVSKYAYRASCTVQRWHQPQLYRCGVLPLGNLVGSNLLFQCYLPSVLPGCPLHRLRHPLGATARFPSPSPGADRARTSLAAMCLGPTAAQHPALGAPAQHHARPT